MRFILDRLRYFISRFLCLSALILLSAQSFGVAIDSARGVVDINTTPQRVAVYNLGSLDTLQALGVAVVGAPKQRFIAELQRIDAADIGTVLHPDLEALNRLAPDLIIVGERSARQYDLVRSIAPTLDLSLGAGGGQAIYQNGIKRLHQLAALFQRSAAADTIAARLDQQRDAARTAAQDAGKGMMVLLSGRQLSLLGKQSLTGWIIEELHLDTSVDKAHDVRAITDVAPISFEYIAAQQPQWIIVVDRNSAIGQESGISARSFFANPIIAHTPASQQQRIIYLNSADALVPIGGVQGMMRTLSFLEQSFLHQ